MILPLHILIALASLVFTAVTFFNPSKLKLKASGVLVILTLASGTYLVISTHVNMVHACVMGLVYTATTSFGIFWARNKLVSTTK